MKDLLTIILQHMLKHFLRILFHHIVNTEYSLRIQSEYRIIQTRKNSVFGRFSRSSKSPYSVRIQENTDQKSSVFGHFSRSAYSSNHVLIKPIESWKILLD